jgi:hypothetical protein
MLTEVSLEFAVCTIRVLNLLEVWCSDGVTPMNHQDHSIGDLPWRENEPALRLLRWQKHSFVEGNP